MLSHISCVLVCLMARFISYRSACQRSRGHQGVVSVASLGEEPLVASSRVVYESDLISGTGVS